MNCTDCKYYLPVDVFKGMCKLSKNEILPDDEFCSKAERLAKCKFCGKFSADRDYLGKCMGAALAYPDMNAESCSNFEWIARN